MVRAWFRARWWHFCCECVVVCRSAALGLSARAIFKNENTALRRREESKALGTTTAKDNLPQVPIAERVQHVTLPRARFNIFLLQHIDVPERTLQVFSHGSESRVREPFIQTHRDRQRRFDSDILLRCIVVGFFRMPVTHIPIQGNKHRLQLQADGPNVSHDCLYNWFVQRADRRQEIAHAGGRRRG